MCQMLAELLGVEKAFLKADLDLLELAGGLPSHDVRLKAEIIGKIQVKTKELGLNPTDSTGQELYASLLGLTKLHDGFLARAMGASDPADVADLLPRIRETALKIQNPKSAWVIKHSAAKRLLKAYPPKKLMKYLGYKSLDSMLKRVPVAELFAGLQLVESQAWYETFLKKYDGLSAMDFEVRSIDVILLDGKKWQKAAEAFIMKQRHILTHVRELGVVVILPAPFKRRAGFSITVLPQVLHHMNEIRLYTSFYKLHQMRPDLGQIMAASLLRDERNHFSLGGHQVHWRVAQRHFGRKGNHPEVLEPHVQPDDLGWRKTEMALYELEPALHFWYDFDYVGAMHDGRPLSFNLMDMALNYINEIPYDQRVYHHFQDSLWNELYTRYLGQPALEAEVLRQLDFEADFTELTSQPVMAGAR